MDPKTLLLAAKKSRSQVLRAYTDALLAIHFSKRLEVERASRQQLRLAPNEHEALVRILFSVDVVRYGVGHMVNALVRKDKHWQEMTFGRFQKPVVGLDAGLLELRCAVRP